MIRKTEGLQVSYILTEGERASLATDRAKEFVKNRLANLEEYIVENGRALCFFTDTPVHINGEDSIYGSKDGWEINVTKNGVMYQCIHDIDLTELTLEKNRDALEAYTFLLWRNGDGGFSYTEHIGDCVNENSIDTVEATKYNDCEEAKMIDSRVDSNPDIIIEEFEIKESDKDFLRRQLLGHFL